MLSSVLCKLPPCRSSSEERAAHAHDARQAAPPSTAHWPCHRASPPPVLMTTRRARPASLAQPYRPTGASAGACARSGRDGTLPGSAVLGHVHRWSGVGWDGNEQAAASQISRSHMLRNTVDRTIWNSPWFFVFRAPFRKRKEKKKKDRPSAVCAVPKSASAPPAVAQTFPQPSLIQN